MTQDTISIILLAIIFASLMGLYLVARWVVRFSQFNQQHRRVNQHVVPAREVRQTKPDRGTPFISNQDVGKFRNWINQSLSSLSSEKLQVRLSSAYWAITDTEFILLRVFSVFLSFLLGWLFFGSILLGLFLGVTTAIIPPIILERAVIKRQRQFQEQLLDVLVLIKGAVQAGYGLMQALDIAVNEIPKPASEEFGRLVHEIRIGISLEGALYNLAERMESDDLQIVVTAIIINAQVGGSLATVLEGAISTIRDRMQLLGEIRSLTSYARYVGTFLTMMPFITGLLIFMITPGYFETVTTSLLTQVIFMTALFMMVIGNIWIRRLIQIRV